MHESPHLRAVLSDPEVDIIQKFIAIRIFRDFQNDVGVTAVKLAVIFLGPRLHFEFLQNTQQACDWV